MKTWWVCSAWLGVDDEELDAIDGSAAEGDDDIAPEADTDDDIAEDEE